LSDLKVNAEHLEAVAAGAMENLWVKTNPEPIRDVEQIRQLLTKAW
jgi:alcohol dehydrogenase class IV